MSVLLGISLTSLSVTRTWAGWGLEDNLDVTLEAARPAAVVRRTTSEGGVAVGRRMRTYEAGRGEPDREIQNSPAFILEEGPRTGDDVKEKSLAGPTGTDRKSEVLAGGGEGVKSVRRRSEK